MAGETTLVCSGTAYRRHLDVRMQIVEEIDQNPQSRVIAAVEGEHQAGQFGQGRFVALDSKGGAGAEGSVFEQIGKPAGNLGEFGFADGMVKSEDDVIAGISQ